MKSKHTRYQGICWNVTHGKVVGELGQSPPGMYFDPPNYITDENKMTHSDGLPERMGEIISRAERWVDYSSLGPPDGKFLAEIAKGIKAIADSGNKVTIRVLTGNIIGVPTDNDALCEALLNHPGCEVPDDANISMWVGSWRKDVSWNHSKIIAVDGKYLFTGGHNSWDKHYLQWNPVKDVSMELKGEVTDDAHVFLNRMWEYIIKKDKASAIQRLMPDWVPMIRQSRIGVCQWPPTEEPYPPMYERSEQMPLMDAVVELGDIPMISMGRYGALHHDAATANPSDSAIAAMLASAQKSIKMSLQDLGPLAIPFPDGLSPIPGGVWPKEYLREIARAIYERGVDVHIVVSNPNSLPSNLNMFQANYGNGWTCEDVEAEIIRAMKENCEDFIEERAAGLLDVNLKMAFMRGSCGSQDWKERTKTANHAKFFCVDDISYYLGSQNLYIANLAEWGVVVDNEEQTQQILEEYWNKVWRRSYEDVVEKDANVDNVMARNQIDRPPTRDLSNLTDEEKDQLYILMVAARAGCAPNSLMVWLKRGHGLKNKDGLLSDSDPYVKMRIVDREGNTIKPTQTSKVIVNGGRNPDWNEQFIFEGLMKPTEYILKISVLDQDSFLGLKGKVADWLVHDQHLGAATVDLGKLQCSNNFIDMEVTVHDGWFHNSTVVLSLSTMGGWGQ